MSLSQYNFTNASSQSYQLLSFWTVQMGALFSVFFLQLSIQPLDCQFWCWFSMDSCIFDIFILLDEQSGWYFVQCIYTTENQVFGSTSSWIQSCQLYPIGLMFKMMTVLNIHTKTQCCPIAHTVWSRLLQYIYMVEVSAWWLFTRPTMVMQQQHKDQFLPSFDAVMVWCPATSSTVIILASNHIICSQQRSWLLQWTSCLLY